MSTIAENKGFIYEFGKFVLDPQERVLLAEGKSVHLTDKVFDTLLMLVEANGRLLTKEEMMTTLWEESFVEEGNLTNISRLRKILNTDGTQLIETLPKHGYRFKADVTQLDGSTDLLVERRMSVKIKHETDTETAVIAPPRRTNRVAAFAIGLVMIGCVVGAGFYFVRTTEPAVSQINTIAVLPLKSLSAEENNKALGLGLTDALISRLGAIRTITVRPTSAVAKFAGSDADALEIGRRLNVDAVFEGTIQQSENRLRVNARLIRVSTGEQIWTEKFDAPASEIFAATGRSIKQDRQNAIL